MTPEAAPAAPSAAFLVPGDHASRYRTLDAWRGAASLAVVLYHLFDRRAVSWLGGQTFPLVGHLWLGVQLFFVISGYCLAAAVDRGVAENMKARTFLARRARRIGPPYLASVALSFVASAMRQSWQEGFASVGAALARTPGWLWVQNLTLTQWVTLFAKFWAGHPAARPADNESLMNSPHWSLCYEEQFYLVLVGVVALAAFVRPATALVVLTCAVAGANSLHPNLITGLFTDYWLEFACGALLFVRLCRTRTPAAARAFDLSALVAFALLVLWACKDPSLTDTRYQFANQLAVCVAFALLLLLLRPFDERLLQTRIVRVFSWLGTMSYSLYLVHWPMRDLLRGFLPPTDRVDLVADSAVLAATLVVAYGFHRAFERPFMSR